MEKIVTFSVRRAFFGGFIYLMVAVGLLFLLEKGFLSSIYQSNLNISHMRALNYFIPDFEPLRAFVKDEKSIKESALSKYKQYYERIVKIMPDTSEAYYMLGFFAYYQDDIKASIEYYKKSIELNPTFFWSYYNLGLVLLKAHENEKAIRILEEGLKQDLSNSLRLMEESQIFYQIYMYKDWRRRELLQHLYDRLRSGSDYAKLFILVAMAREENLNINELPLSIY